MLQMEELDKIVQSKLNGTISEIYEIIKAGSADYKKIEKNIKRITNEIRWEKYQLGNALKSALLDKMHEDVGDIRPNNRKILYLCDGEVPECEKTHCSLKTPDGWCRHTSDINHAVNFKDFMEKPGVVVEGKEDVRSKERSTTSNT